MRAGMQCLLNLLRGQDTGRAADEAEWAAAFALAEEERVLPWAASCLRSRAAKVPPATEARLGEIERDAAVAAFYWSAELKGVLRAFAQEAIAVVPLKGPFLAERIYGGAALRPCRDLDLLVSKADLARAEGVLAAIGFAAGAEDDYHRPWRRGTTAVELHHDVENPLALDFHVETALRRASPAEFQGERCLKLAPEDELLYLCLHAARHRFERLGLVLDILLGFEHFTGTEAKWNPRPEVAGLDRLLMLGLAMARRLRSDVPLTVNGGRADEDDELLEELADGLWHRLLTQPSGPLDWRAVHSFYLEMERPGWGRLHRRYRHMRILAERVIEPDRAFAARFGLRRDWQARLLRPVRLIAERTRG
jgi:hypothetical protein